MTDGIIQQWYNNIANKQYQKQILIINNKDLQELIEKIKQTFPRDRFSGLTQYDILMKYLIGDNRE